MERNTGPVGRTFSLTAHAREARREGPSTRSSTPRPDTVAARQVTPDNLRGYRLSPPIAYIEQRPRFDVEVFEGHLLAMNAVTRLRKVLEFLRSTWRAFAIESVNPFHYLLCFGRLV